jgi:hypothetical protein
MITEFSATDGFPFHCLDTLCSALLTLPTLEKISCTQLTGEGLKEGQALESMVRLLQAPSLRQVIFGFVAYTNTFSQAVAKVGNH